MRARAALQAVDSTAGYIFGGKCRLSWFWGHLHKLHSRTKSRPVDGCVCGREGGRGRLHPWGSAPSTIRRELPWAGFWRGVVCREGRTALAGTAPRCQAAPFSAACGHVHVARALAARLALAPFWPHPPCFGADQSVSQSQRPFAFFWAVRVSACCVCAGAAVFSLSM